jgi:hypothetical protein
MRGERKKWGSSNGAPFIGDTAWSGGCPRAVPHDGEGCGRGVGPAWRSGSAVWPAAARPRSA